MNPSATDDAHTALRMIRNALDRAGAAALPVVEEAPGDTEGDLVAEATAIVDAIARLRADRPFAQQSVMQRLYDVEINASITSFFDAGFIVRLGDDWNGWHATEVVPSFTQAERWLYRKAKELYFSREQVRAIADLSNEPKD